MKSLTGSGKVIEVLIKLGHSISYSEVEEIETELTFEGTKENRLIPQQMTMDSEAGVGLAFDNFDDFVEALNGKDTLHDIVGIANQISTKDQCQGAEPEQSQPVKAVKNNKRRRAFQASGLDIEPYRKKPKMFSSPMLPYEDERRKSIPINSFSSQWLDLKWMIAFAFSRDVPV